MVNALELLNGGALSMLAGLPDQSVHACVTSPPYWGLRDYGGDPVDWPAVDYVPMAGLDLSPVHVPAWSGQLGHEETPGAFVGHLVAIFREVRRVLRGDGTLWLNLGDSFVSGKGSSANSKARETAADRGWKQNGGTVAMPTRPADSYTDIDGKNLIGIPWRVAMALQADGWYLRMDNIWAKPNPMPESVTDRPGKSHEYFFLLSKSPRYFYDREAVKVPATDYAARLGSQSGKYAEGAILRNDGGRHLSGGYESKDPNFRNLRSVWSVPVGSYTGAHFAVFPPDLILPCILAGTSARGVCPECGAGYVRLVDRSPMITKPSPGREERSESGRLRTQTAGTMVKAPESATVGWAPGCDCDAGDPLPAVVLDPFGGSGTTGAVAIEHGRRAVLIEQNAEYLPLIRERVARTQPKLINF